MNKLLTTCLVFFVIAGNVYAQKEVSADDVHTTDKQLKTKTDKEKLSTVTDSTITPLNNSEKTVSSDINILAKNNNFYRVNKGQKGMFFVVQDFYTDGEKRTDPFLITDIKKANNNKFDILNYDHMGINGLLITWFENGQVEQKGVFDQGKRKGLWAWWYENGQKRSAGHYIDGLKEGPWTVWYKHGKRMQKGYYQTDRKEGVWIYWYRNGKKKEAGRYNDDQQVERWSYWTDSGKLIKNEYKETEIKIDDN